MKKLTFSIKNMDGSHEVTRKMVFNSDINGTVEYVATELVKDALEDHSKLSKLTDEEIVSRIAEVLSSVYVRGSIQGYGDETENMRKQLQEIRRLVDRES